MYRVAFPQRRQNDRAAQGARNQTAMLPSWRRVGPAPKMRTDARWGHGTPTKRNPTSTGARVSICLRLVGKSIRLQAPALDPEAALRHLLPRDGAPPPGLAPGASSERDRSERRCPRKRRCQAISWSSLVINGRTLGRRCGSQMPTTQHLPGRSRKKISPLGELSQPPTPARVAPRHDPIGVGPVGADRGHRSAHSTGRAVSRRRACWTHQGSLVEQALFL